MNHYEQLKSVLNDIFELNKADLDFGIYRIINQKRKQVNAFIEQQLPLDIKEALSNTQPASQVELEQELKQLKKSLEELDIVAEENPKYLAKLEQLKAAGNSDALEQDVFSHLANFFRRYYKDGDFISMRRYKKDVYAIPYEGEEVKLHWANHDQYYIKSSENFKNYSFKLPDGPKITFQLKEANTEQNNNKTQGDAERRFALYTEQPVESTEGELFINFVYEPFPKATKQDDLKLVAYKTILEQLPENFATLKSEYRNDKGEGKTRKEKINGKDVEISVDILFHHLNSYISKNSFDYFIHKDLGGFLHRELDFYIKNEVLYIDDINDREPAFFVAQLGKVKALKAVASKIIEFLAQIENFQKKLWLKKKFVLRTDYCITLDRIDATFYPEIFDNKTQLEAWKSLYGVEIANAEQLVFEPFLVLDTQFFSEEFKDRLLYEFKDLDAETDGLLINSENFQALGLLQEKYREGVKCVYIDPPYNTGGDGFFYKDNFRHSSWLSMIHDRLELTRDYLNDAGVLYASIDANEATHLEIALNNIFGIENRVEEVIWAQNSNKNQSPTFSTNHEYVPVYSKDISTVKQDYRMFREIKPGFAEIMELIDELNPNYPSIKTIESALKTLYKNHREELEDEENDEWKGIYNYNHVEYRDANGKMVPENEAPKAAAKIWVWREDNPSMPQVKEDSQKSTFRDPESPEFRFYQPIHPITGRPCPAPKRGWVWPYEAHGNQKNWFKKLADDDRIAWGENEEKIPQTKKFLHEVETNVSKSIVTDFTDGEKQLTDIFGKTRSFSNPKPTTLIRRFVGQCNVRNEFCMDYFAGSGTTGHAVIKLNREDGGRRKYILVEMGQYFNTVTKPRIQKVIYTDNWKNGQPQDKGGISQMVKYQVLESYEDTLNNLQLQAPSEQGLLEFSPRAQEEYLLQYMLDIESREHLLNLAMFRKPFDYQLNVTEHNELRPVRVDLVETFNYLIGLHVRQVQRVKDMKVVEGVTRTGVRTLVIWRDLDTTTQEEVAKLVRRFYDGTRTREFQQIFINGDHHLENIRVEGDQFKIRLIEETFFKKMFDETDL